MIRWHKATVAQASCLLLCFSLTTGVRGDFIFNAASDFSATSNPNGVWSSGWSATLGSPFILDTATGTFGPAIDQWRGNIAADGNPSVYHNRTGSTVTFGTFSLLPEQLAFHPGPNGEISLVRWTAPSDGDVSISALFTGRDFVGPTTTDVHVLHNGSALFNGSVSSFGSGPSSATSFSVLQGDRIDFAVGFGSDMSFLFDTTGLDATITLAPSGAVPEPASLTLLGIGILVLLGRSWRRRIRAA